MALCEFLPSAFVSARLAEIELGEPLLLRRLHDLDPPSSLVLPELRPFTGAETRISRAELPEDDREFLLARLEDLRDRYAHLEFALPQGPIHGNASVNSVLPLMWDGSPVLVDLDGFAVGPREWDLVLTAMYFERFGWHTDEEYLEFAAAYGFDVTNWPGYTVLRNVRELTLLTWLAITPGTCPRYGRRFAGVSRICRRQCRLSGATDESFRPAGADLC